MKKYTTKFLKCLLLAVFTMQGVYALDAGTADSWKEPTEAQIQDAAADRLPLSAEEESGERFCGPNSEVTRYYTNVELTACERKDPYSPIGHMTYRNTTGAPVLLRYVQDWQGETKTTDWDVTDNIRDRGDIKAAVISKIEQTLGVSVGMSTTTPRSGTVLGTMTIPAYKTGTISAYHSAVEIQGTVLWQDADGSGTVYATGREKIGGAFIIDGVYLKKDLQESR